MSLLLQVIASVQTDDASVVITRQVHVEPAGGETPDETMERKRQEVQASALSFIEATVREVMPPVQVSIGIAPNL